MQRFPLWTDAVLTLAVTCSNRPPAQLWRSDWVRAASAAAWLLAPRLHVPPCCRAAAVVAAPLPICSCEVCSRCHLHGGAGGAELLGAMDRAAPTRRRCVWPARPRGGPPVAARPFAPPSCPHPRLLTRCWHPAAAPPFPRCGTSTTACACTGCPTLAAPATRQTCCSGAAAAPAEAGGRQGAAGVLHRRSAAACGCSHPSRCCRSPLPRRRPRPAAAARPPAVLLPAAAA